MPDVAVKPCIFCGKPTGTFLQTGTTYYRLCPKDVNTIAILVGPAIFAMLFELMGEGIEPQR